jgi:GR25 family glycosyltransferase involved in LPS biosynthesis
LAVVLNKETLCFKVFHIENTTYQSISRGKLKKELDSMMSEFATELDTPTINIYSEYTLLSFYKDNEDICIDPKGMQVAPEWDISRYNGWRFGELGIYASNLTAWKNFLASDFEYAVLMEDDFQINNTFKDHLTEYMQELPDDWEVLSMHMNPNEDDRFNEHYDIGKPNVCKTYHRLSMACYVINKRFVRKALELIKTPITEPFDVYVLNEPYKFNSYSIKPGKPKGCRCLGSHFAFKSTFQEREPRQDLSALFERNDKADKFPNWFDGDSIANFDKYLDKYKGKDNLNFLQIGVFTGRASVWLLDNILTSDTSKLVDLDPWLPYEQIPLISDWNTVEKAYDEQVAPYTDKINKVKMHSKEWLENNTDHQFDFIYIDGDHSPDAAFSDGELSWGLLKPSGVMAFDDYLWEHPEGLVKDPKEGIDRFLELHKNELTILLKDRQVWLTKTTE